MNETEKAQANKTLVLKQRNEDATYPRWLI